MQKSFTFSLDILFFIQKIKRFEKQRTGGNERSAVTTISLDPVKKEVYEDMVKI